MAMSPRLLRPLATGFNPKSISDLAVWLDASDASTITLNGGNVSAWGDKSGNGRNFTQGTALAQPLYATGAMNGRAVVRADGSNHFMERTAGTAMNAASLTFVFAVRYMTWITDSSRFPDLFDTDLQAFDTDGMRYSQYNNQEGIFVGDTDSQQGLFTSGGSALLTARVVAISYNGSSGALVLRGNGSQLTSGTISAANRPTGFDLGTRGPFILFAGFWNVAQRRANAEIGECLVYSRALTASELSRAERGIGRKWGITVA
jgi:hypothetical protein